MTRSLTVVALAWMMAGALAAQAPSPPAQPAPQTPARATRPAPRAQPAAQGRAVNVAVKVTDGVGLGLSGVRVIVNGPVTRDGQTVADGSFRALGLKPGAYRFRFEHEQFVTLERDVTVRGGQPTDVDVMLTRAPEPEKPKEPEPAPAPTPEVRASAPLPAATFHVADYLEKEYLKSGPNRIRSIACSSSDAVSVVQTTSSYASAAGERQLVAVAIAGQGRVSIGGRTSSMDSRSGTTVVVPANAGFEATREGKSTLVFVLVELGGSCEGSDAQGGR
jgi:hypothetical protein